MTEYFNITSSNWVPNLIIAALLFLLLKHILRNFIPNKPIINISSFISAIILTPVLYGLFLVALFFFLFNEYHPDRKFSEIHWKERVNDRFEMNKDLIESNFLMSKSRTEVLDILGEPSHNKDNPNFSENKWAYYSGMEGWGFGIKVYQLYIDFDHNKVVKVESKEFID